MDAIWLILLLPLLGALLCGSLSRSLGRVGVGLVACVAVGGAFLVAASNALNLWWSGNPAATEVVAWNWMSVPTSLFDGRMRMMSVDFGAYIDPLSSVMLCVITGVGFLIHWFSTEYMEDEPDYGRFFTYLNLFVAAMSLLVMANNFIVLLIGWGGVGFASYGLIGFWNFKPSAAAAARKAFVINVIGDVGLMVAIFLMAWIWGSTDFSVVLHGPELVAPAEGESNPVFPLTQAIAVFLLVAAYAKSAQLPLHTWLPDAMEGPTPVSALIHAATMVTAGVYLVVRSHVFFEAWPNVQMWVVTMGLFTAVVAATAAMVQTDLKRVLAYSTMSQLGYMFMAAGVGAYSAAIFHLVTHAFFKALLFLSAGIVIHAAHGEQDMRKLGGLGPKMPTVAFLFGVGGLCLAGFPLTSGFFSKEAILLAVEHSPLPLAPMFYYGGALTAVLTAYYTARAYFMTFHGPSHFEHKLHPSGAPMVISCLCLAILALGAGWGQASFSVFMAPTHEVEHVPLFGILPVLVIAALALGYHLHGRSDSTDWASANEDMMAYFRSGWRFDELYTMMSTGTKKLSGMLATAVDTAFGEAIPDFLGRGATGLAGALTHMQSGQLRHYALMLMVTVFLFLICNLLTGGAWL
ncbi:MAG: NADH-quinone oxidoreductase subunit L [Vulcanimicrobiota bacterium]